MLVLALETSSQEGSVAILRDTPRGVEVLAMETLAKGDRSAKTLYGVLKCLLERFGGSPRGVGLVCVASGPGSFTGLRVGVSATKLLAYCWQSPAIGVSTLKAIAYQAALHFTETGGAAVEGPLVVEAVLDAQRQELFAEKYLLVPEAPLEDLQGLGSGPEIIGRQAWLQRLVAGELVSGPPLVTLCAKLPAGVIAATDVLLAPTAVTIGKLGLAQWKAGDKGDPFALMPIYVRPSAAEEKASSSPT
ncbi:MAG: tRNA (adenosine(37)-N6)-threonylcarbamoyltransferase complex dimerization subunit type 1 TsaB [Planctomycetaceae bacterium]